MDTDIVLIAGLWLPCQVWDPVVAGLTERGHRAVAVALPGVDDGDATATLADQVDAVLAAVDAVEHPIVVGHSAASTLAWLVADRRPDRVARTVLIGGFPTANGDRYAAYFDLVDGVMPFPGWEPFAGPDSDDLDPGARERIAATAVPVTEGVAHGVVRLTDPRRFGVPTTLVCPEFTPDDVRSWIASGDLPEVASTEQVELVDLETGHWPMVSDPDALIVALDRIATPDLVTGGGS